jgi:hypothetical protein
VAELALVAAQGRVERVEEHIVGVLGIGLHVARVASEQLTHRGAGLARYVLEEDVIAVGDDLRARSRVLATGAGTPIPSKLAP